MNNDMRGSLLDRNALKWIAVVSMLLDHIGHVLIYRFYLEACIVDGVVMMGGMIPAPAQRLYLLYLLLRIVGRLALPIFAFMLVEGFRHTHDRKKYLGRILLFAILSEIPYDLAGTGSLLDLSSQNVLWTFAFAIGMMWLLEKYAAARKTRVGRFALTALIVLAAAACSIRSDGSSGGILLIASMYLFRKKRVHYWAGCLFALCVIALQFMWIQLFAVFALLLLELYNGGKGRGGKYLFYVYYPAHLLALYLLTMIFF